MAQLSPQERLVLAAIPDGDGLTASAIAELVGIEPVDAILHLHRLARFQLVRRESDASTPQPTYWRI